MAKKETVESAYISLEMIDALDGLTIQQRRFIVALQGHKTIRGASSAAGVGESSVYRWFREDVTFVEALADVERIMLSHQVRQMQAGWGEAVDALRDAIRSARRPETRVQAAKALLELTLRARAQNLATRVDALEARQLALEVDWKALQSASPEELERQFLALQASEGAS